MEIMELMKFVVALFGYFGVCYLIGGSIYFSKLEEQMNKNFENINKNFNLINNLINENEKFKNINQVKVEI